MKRVAVFLLFLGLGAWLFLWTVERIGWEAIWQSALEFSGLKGLSILLLTFLLLLVGAVRWKRILAYQGYAVPLARLWPTYLASYALMFFVPMMFLAAEFFRSYAARSMHGIPFPKALASNVIERLLEMSVYVVFILLGAAVFLASAASFPPQALALALGAIVLLGGGLAFFYVRSFQKKSILHLFLSRSQLPDFWELEKEVFKFFRWNNRALWEGLAWSVAKTGIAFARAWLLVAFLGKIIGPLTALSVLAFQYTALLVPIPASLGSHDVLQAFAFEGTGIGSSTGAAYALLMRSVEALAALVALVFAARIALVLLSEKATATLHKFLKT